MNGYLRGSGVRPSPRVRDILFLLLVVGALAGVVAFLTRGARPKRADESISAPASTSPGSGLLSYWIGDTWLGGLGVGGFDDGIAASVAKSEGWSWSLDLQAASGWTQTGIATNELGAVPFAQRVDQAVAHHPRIVLVEGGINDAAHGATATEVEAGVTSTVTTLRAKLPAGVPVVVIGPQWADSEVPAAVLAVRTAVSAAATSLHVPFIDPIGERWVTGQRPTGDFVGSGQAASYTSADGTNPSATGTKAYAARLVADLHTLGIQVTR